MDIIDINNNDINNTCEGLPNFEHHGVLDQDLAIGLDIHQHPENVWLGPSAQHPVQVVVVMEQQGMTYNCRPTTRCPICRLAAQASRALVEHGHRLCTWIQNVLTK